ncbi:serine/threonine-protein kinase [cf. Phormidesmis sp. LEGE 11477]|uniref:serine/threonine protein kinase n=1 Tax=cf. Phormidesmis sp. LEGE 11477 TaxID=1828680 RepID=UPI001881A728|nr:serine/threonine-protein kinase [cf. Phormidesmis sp. LEGE 11477]MBE9059498.1 serine/threonine protein kinase [cf. Phormidesmis sp. LEGE 11477]
MSSLIGKRLQGGKYKLESVLGRGGFGLTFKAHQAYLEQVVVIKTLNESFWTAPNLEDLQKQFQDEGRRLALCQHPNVVRVTDFFVEDYLPYMVMDYIPGRSLYDIVFDHPNGPQPLSEAIALRYIQQIGNALQAIHTKGLLHRDVKPQNIMVHERTKEAVLIDFGIARELTPNPAKTHTSIVSEGYAPIEQYLPKAQRSAATDVYGLAATLYLLLTAEVPVAAVLRDRTPMIPIQQLRPEISPVVVNAIAQGMQIELKDRPQSVARWLSLLTTPQKPGQQKTGQQNASWQDPSFSHSQTPAPNSQPLLPLPASPSQFPTKVVAPAYQTDPYQTDYRSAKTSTNASTNAPVNTAAKTVVVPVPRKAETAIAPNQPINQPANQADYNSTQKQGNGCGLFIVALVLTGLAAAGGFWVVQQILSRDADAPTLEPTEIEVPEPVLEEPVEADLEEDEGEDAEEQEEPEELEAVDENLEEPDEEIPLPPEPEQPSDTGEQTPPLLLEDSGNPGNAQPGASSEIVPIPGFPPGSSRNRVQSRLGSPNRAATVNGFPIEVYNLMPNRVRLAYVFDPQTRRVQQTEATFSPAIDRYQIRTALTSTLKGGSTLEIERGLYAVVDGKRDRYDFTTQRLSGTIRRNRHGHIHIYVRD